jgi:hypothetical protein
MTGKNWKTFVISIALLISSPILADMGLPDIQAICRITQKDGKTIEGILLMGKGGYQRYLDTNGFYIIAENPPHRQLKRAVLFSLRFQAIMPFKGKVMRGRSTSTNPTLANNPRVYYLHDITSKKHYTDDTKIEETLKQNKNLLILERKITHDLVYELLDHIPVYPKLPDVIHLESGHQQKETIKPLMVPVIQIEKFELLRNPPRKWLDDIAEKTGTWDQKYGTCDDCVLLVEWYHELVKKPEKQQEYVEKAFKPWIF